MTPHIMFLDSCDITAPVGQVGLREQLQHPVPVPVPVPVPTERPSKEVRRQVCILTASYIGV